MTADIVTVAVLDVLHPVFSLRQTSKVPTTARVVYVSESARCGSKLNRRGYAGFGPHFHLPGFHFGTEFLSHSLLIESRNPTPRKQLAQRT